jgi:hypothetical protein
VVAEHQPPRASTCRSTQPDRRWRRWWPRWRRTRRWPGAWSVRTRILVDGCLPSPRGVSIDPVTASRQVTAHKLAVFRDGRASFAEVDPTAAELEEVRSPLHPTPSALACSGSGHGLSLQWGGGAGSRQVSCLYKEGGRLCGWAADPPAMAAAMDRMALGPAHWERHLEVRGGTPNFLCIRACICRGMWDQTVQRLAARG